MTRRDKIFQSFLKHELLKNKYELVDDDCNTTVAQGLDSNKPIIKTIALIVETLEVQNAISDEALYKKVSQYLNTAAI